MVQESFIRVPRRSMSRYWYTPSHTAKSNRNDSDSHKFYQWLLSSLNIFAALARRLLARLRDPLKPSARFMFAFAAQWQLQL